MLDGATPSFAAAHDNRIVGNFIGVGYSVVSGNYLDRGNGGAGVTVAGPANDISSNYIDYNGGYGVSVINPEAHDNTLSNNEIGILGFSLTDTGAGNAGGVVFQSGAHDNQVGGGAISFNGGTGIRVVNGQRNLIDAPAYGNGGLGIDLAGAGVTGNDNDSGPQAVDYANRGLNFPLLTSATSGPAGTIAGSLLTTQGTYRITLFASVSCDPSGHGEGQFFLGSSLTTTAATGVGGQFLASFAIQPPVQPNPSVPFITATAQDFDGNTSEFSACIYLDDFVFANGFE